MVKRDYLWLFSSVMLLPWTIQSIWFTVQIGIKIQHLRALGANTHFDEMLWQQDIRNDIFFSCFVVFFLGHLLWHEIARQRAASGKGK